MMILKLIKDKLSSELGIFGLFKRPKKRDIEPASRQPTQSELFFTKPLRDVATLATRSAQGEQNVPGIGFGPDFVSKATNPVVKDRLTRFREDTIPELEAQQSSRGISRSSIATEQLARRGREVQSDIDQLLSKFFILNEQQKKSDETRGLNLANSLQGEEARLLGNRATEDLNIALQTNADAVARRDKERAQLNAIGDRSLQAIGQGIPAFSGAGSASSAAVPTGISGQNLQSVNAILNSQGTSSLRSFSVDDLFTAFVLGI